MPTRQITDLNPTEFENLVFDLIRTSGMFNVEWRTPGADGGRDIEGQHIEHDFAGHQVVARWYIEAKRYQVAVDWPTVWKKAAYAQNAGSQYLLMVTTSSFSPRCLDEIRIWNERHSSPKIRCWPSSELQYRLRLQPSVGVKYGIMDPKDKLVPALGPLAEHLAKSAMAALETGSDLAFGNANIYLQCAATLAELLLIRTEDLTVRGHVSPRRPLKGEPWFSWLERSPASALDDVDTPAVRALVCAMMMVTRASGVAASVEGRITLRALEPKYPLLPAGQKLIDTILLWGNLEAFCNGNELLIMRQKGNANG